MYMPILYNRLTVLFAILFLTAGCMIHTDRDYDASAKCQARGYEPGTVSYNDCMEDEHIQKIMEQQRREMEDIQRRREDQKWLRY